jgi:hypothetical protein
MPITRQERESMASDIAKWYSAHITCPVFDSQHQQRERKRERQKQRQTERNREMERERIKI